MIATNLKRVLLASAASCVVTATAFAQSTDQGEQVEQVVVTGTIIKGIAPVGTNVLNYDASDIQAVGAITTNQVFANIPQISSNFNSVPTVAGAGNTQVSKPNIRNLAPYDSGTSTLLLVNGHTSIGVGVLENTSDGTIVPGIALQRVDVMPDGGSALYGSSAVAGIINMVTRQDYEGIEGKMTWGTTGNYDSVDVGVIGGHAWNSGSAMLAVEYKNNSAQMYSDIDYSRQNLTARGGQDSRSSACPLANVTANNVTYALSSNTVSTTAGSLAAAATVGKNLCDTSVLYQSLYPAERQYNIFGSFKQHIATGIDFSMTAAYASHTAINYVAPPSVSNAVITANNPYFQAISGETSQLVSFDFSSITGNKVYQVATNYNEEEITPSFDFNLGNGWTATTLFDFGRSTTQAYDQAGGDMVAIDNALTSSDPLVALDPYNLAASNPSAIQQAILYSARTYDTVQLAQVHGVVNGTLFSLPGGDVKVALGAQYQFDSVNGSDITGPVGQFAGPAVNGGFLNTAKAHRTIDSFFGELVVPVVGPDMGIPFLRSVELDLQGRYDHYSDVGTTTNPKIGVTVEPIEGLKIRANRGTSFNAPSLDDLAGAVDARVQYVPVSYQSFFTTDYYDLIYNGGRNLARPSLLVAGGNPKLVPQTANTYSYGFDYSPKFVDGLSFGMTRYHVKLEHEIGLPVSGSFYFDPAYSSLYVRNPTLAQAQAFLASTASGIPNQGFQSLTSLYANPATTPYLIVDMRRRNNGHHVVEGIDFHIDYVRDMDFGSISTGVSGTDYTKNVQQIIQGVGDTNLLTTGLSPYSFSVYAGGVMGDLTARVTMNYSAGYSVTGIPNQTHVGAFKPVNLYLGYDMSGLSSWLSNSTFNFNISNLLGEDPPKYNSAPGYANGGTLGRLFQISISKKF